MNGWSYNYTSGLPNTDSAIITNSFFSIYKIDDSTLMADATSVAFARIQNGAYYFGGANYEIVQLFFDTANINNLTVFITAPSTQTSGNYTYLKGTKVP